MGCPGTSTGLRPAGARRAPAPSEVLAAGPGRGDGAAGCRWVNGGRTGAPGVADGAAVRPTGGASGARGPVAGPPGVSRGIGRTRLALSPMVCWPVRASAETVCGDPGDVGNDGLTGAAVPAGWLGVGRAGAAGLAGGGATLAAGADVLAGLPAAGLAPPGAERCNGGRSTCTGGRNGVPLPAPITIEGREPELGSVFSGSGPRGLT